MKEVVLSSVWQQEKGRFVGRRGRVVQHFVSWVVSQCIFLLKFHRYSYWLKRQEMRLARMRWWK